MTFTKLFSSITESTVWMEDPSTRLVWITMLAMSDRLGRVWASVPGLAHKARVPVEDCRAALNKFLSDDEESRTKDCGGKRIEVIDGGWRLINHAKYRAIRDEEAILESKRKYINERRKRERVENVEQGRANAEADAAQIHKEERVASLPDSFEEEKQEPEKKSKEPSKPSFHPDAHIALAFLNDRSGSTFRPVESNLSLLSARLSEAGVTLEGVRQMVDRQCRKWGGTKMAEYLRPSTLFAKTKFDEYYASKDQPVINENTAKHNHRNDGIAVGVTDYGKAARRKMELKALASGHVTPSVAQNAGA